MTYLSCIEETTQTLEKWSFLGTAVSCIKYLSSPDDHFSCTHIKDESVTIEAIIQSKMTVNNITSIIRRFPRDGVAFKHSWIDKVEYEINGTKHMLPPVSSQDEMTLTLIFSHEKYVPKFTLILKLIDHISMKNALFVSKQETGARQPAARSMYSSTDIMCAAIKHGYSIFSLPRPYRHCHIIKAMVLACDIPKPIPQDGQGFLTTNGCWVGRKEAREIAIKRKQCIKTQHPDELFSEDLW